jgi:hypothetical protein
MLDDALLGCVPEPVSVTDCESPPSRSVVVSTPLLDPVIVGLNVREIVQLMPAARLPIHVSSARNPHRPITQSIDLRHYCQGS